MWGQQRVGLGAEDAQVADIGFVAVEQFIWHLLSAFVRGKVPDVVGGAQGFSPQVLGRAGLDEHGPGAVQQGPVEALCLAVLLRRVGHCQVVLNAVGLEVVGQFVVDVLAAVVAAHGAQPVAAMNLHVLQHLKGLQRHGCLGLQGFHNGKARVVVLVGGNVAAAAI